MLWFFERSDEVLELETRYDNETGEYVVEQRAPGGPVQMERYSDAESFRRRLEIIEQSLNGQSWLQKGAPAILADGWPDRTPPR
jgi:hypothetical protein